MDKWIKVGNLGDAVSEKGNYSLNFCGSVPLILQTPERPHTTVQTEIFRGRASSPRRAAPVGEARFYLAPRIHRASDPGLPGDG